MANCESCGIELKSDKYKYCWECNQKMKQLHQNNGKEVVNELSHINNNLYFIRRALAVILREQYAIAIEWDKKEKDFAEVNL